jgi:hypothetical protein
MQMAHPSAKPAINNSMSNNPQATATPVPLDPSPALSQPFSNVYLASTFKILFASTAWQIVKYAKTPIPAPPVIQAILSPVQAPVQPVLWLLVRSVIVMAVALSVFLVFMDSPAKTNAPVFVAYVIALPVISAYRPII